MALPQVAGLKLITRQLAEKTVWLVHSEKKGASSFMI